jgi:hypothetical protein
MSTQIKKSEAMTIPSWRTHATHTELNALVSVMRNVQPYGHVVVAALGRARALGLCTLVDDGPVRLHGRYFDRERWDCRLTDAGRLACFRYLSASWLQR